MHMAWWSRIVAISLGLIGVACGAAAVEQSRTPVTAASSSGQSSSAQVSAPGGERLVPVQLQADGGLPVGPAPIFFDAGVNAPIPLGPDAGAPF